MAKLEVICGPMFAGKTEEFIRRIKRCTIAKQKVQVFKPSMDFRYGVDRITSHGKTDLETATGVIPVAISEDDRLVIDDDTEVVGFDESQFFASDWIVPVVVGLTNANIRVICACLDTNSYGEPFGSTPNLLALADSVTKLTSICKICHKEANRTYREIPYAHTNVAVSIGGSEVYEPRCLDCWKPTSRI